MKRAQLKFFILSQTVLVLTSLNSTIFTSPAKAQDYGQYSGQGQNSEQAPVGKLEAVRYITWWFHDATGYHPAILVQFENVSNQDLSGTRLRFQAQFRNLANGYVNISNTEKRIKLEPGDKIEVFLQGPNSIELPIDRAQWPKMECKVMARLGEEGAETSQTLLVARLDQVTMSTDEASNLFGKQPDLRPKKKRSTPAVSRTPLAATTGVLGEKKPKYLSSTATLSQLGTLNGANHPGLGDDFFHFEKKFGLPIETDTNDLNWTWAHYQPSDGDFSLYAGAPGQSDVVEIIIVKLPGDAVKNESEFLSMAKAMSGKFGRESLSTTTHSVRYLRSGRLKIEQSVGKGLQAAHLLYGSLGGPQAASGGSSSINLLILTKSAGNIFSTLRKDTQKAKILRFLGPISDIQGNK